MSFRPAGRDDPNAVIAFGIGHMQDGALAQTQEVDPFLTIGLPFVDPFNGEGIVTGCCGVVECDAMAPPVQGGLVRIRLKVLLDGFFLLWRDVRVGGDGAGSGSA